MKNLLLITLLSLSSLGKANLIVVDSNKDTIAVDGECTLREALTAANFDIFIADCNATGLGDDLIWVLLEATNDGIQLDNQLPIIDGVDIQGPGADSLVLFPAVGNNEHIFQINTDRDVSLKDFRIGGSKSSAVDVVNVRDFEIANMKFLSNTAGSSGTYGGAIHADMVSGDTESIAELLINDTLFSANGAGFGGALAVSGRYTVTINNSQFNQNSSTSNGGAIFRQNNSSEVSDIINSDLNITNSQFNSNSSNTLGGAISLDLAKLDINTSVFYENQGQNVIDVFRSLSVIENSLFAENPVNTVIRHRNFNGSTVSTELSLSFNTFVDNQNFDVENSSGGALLETYLYANAFANTNATNRCSGAGTSSLGFNVERFGSSCTSHPGDMPNTNPMLLPLGLYDGNVLIAPPSPISPLVDAASGCDSNDLSGIGRQHDGDGSGTAECDIGAVERPDAYGLTVDFSGNGEGQVYLDEFNLNCPVAGTCYWPLPQSESYLLSAQAESGSTFNTWMGDCSGNSNCSITMSEAKFATADFELLSNPVNLAVNVFKTVNTLGADIVSNPVGIDCGQICSFDFEEQQEVVLTITPHSNSIVDDLDGCDMDAEDNSVWTCTIFLGVNDTEVNVYLAENADYIFFSGFETP
jgi:CSLREA domain-containing protein